jgi:hypothetical protein
MESSSSDHDIHGHIYGSEESEEFGLNETNVTNLYPPIALDLRNSHIINENGDQTDDNNNAHDSNDDEDQSAGSASSGEIKLQGPVRPLLPPLWFKEPTALCMTGTSELQLNNQPPLVLKKRGSFSSLKLPRWNGLKKSTSSPASTPKGSRTKTKTSSKGSASEIFAPAEGVELLARLPNEVLYVVLSFLSVSDLAHTAQVCRQFKKLVDIGEIWKQVVIRSYGPRHCYIVHFLGKWVWKETIDSARMKNIAIYLWLAQNRKPVSSTPSTPVPAPLKKAGSFFSKKKSSIDTDLPNYKKNEIFIDVIDVIRSEGPTSLDDSSVVPEVETTLSTSLTLQASTQLENNNNHVSDPLGAAAVPGTVNTTNTLSNSMVHPGFDAASSGTDSISNEDKKSKHKKSARKNSAEPKTVQIKSRDCFYVNGVVEMRSFISGMPICVFGYNDSNVKHDDDRTLTELADVTFHNSVNVNLFQKERLICFTPPDKTLFQLMRYRSSQATLPFKIRVRTFEKQATLTLKIKITCTVAASMTARDVHLDIPMPENIAVEELKAEGGKAVQVEGADLLNWNIGKMRGESSCKLNVSVRKNVQSKQPWQKPPLQCSMTVEGHRASTLRALYVKVIGDQSARGLADEDGMSPVTTYVRYITIARVAIHEW